MSANVAKAVAVTADLLGTELSAAALSVMVSDLSAYPENDVLAALVRCRRELTSRLSLAAIIERVQGADGRPSADEAWAVAMLANDEEETIVWTDEMSKAYFQAARPLLDCGDKIGARMAFRDAYNRLIETARQEGARAVWSASPGSCSVRRKEAIERAIERKQITAERAKTWLPSVKYEDSDPIAKLISQSPVRLISNNGERISGAVEDVETIKSRLSALRNALNRGQA